jgi:hypothetical protein
LCPKDISGDECARIKESYAEIKNYYLNVAGNLYDTLKNCDDESLDAFSEDCPEHIERTLDVARNIAQRTSSGNRFGEAFSRLIKEGVYTLCNELDGAQDRNRKCLASRRLVNELYKIVYQKNELYAIGLTLKDMRNRIPLQSQSRSQKENAFGEFIERLIHARIFHGSDLSTQDYYYCDDALEFLLEDRIQINNASNDTLQNKNIS